MLKIKNLSKKIKNKIIFENKELNIHKNTLTFIVSPSGSGKTTLLNLIGGLDKDYEGTIEYIKNENSIINLKNKNDLIDFVFQDFNLLESLTVEENLKISQNIVGKDFPTKKQEELLSFFKLENDTLKKKVSKLSIGEKQRIAILRAITRNSVILLADEPTGNLDKNNSEIIFQLLKEISKNKTVVVVSHDIESAKKYADNIYDLEKNTMIKNNSNISKNNYLDKIEKFKINSDETFLNKTKPIFSMVKADFFRKKIQFILVTLMLIFSILSIGVFFGMNSNAQNAYIKNSITTNSDLVVVQKEDNSSILEDEKTKMQNLDFVKHIVPIYENEMIDNFYISNDKVFKKYRDLNISLIDSSVFYKERLSKLKISGSLINNYDEIIIGKDILGILEIHNPSQTKVLDLNLNSGEEPIKLKIVGINNEKNSEDKYETFFHYDLLKKIIEEQKNKIDIAKTFVGMTNYNYESNTNNYLFNGIVASSNKDKIIKGRNIQNANEILLPFSTENEKIDLNDEWVINVLGSNWKVKVVGLYEDLENTNLLKTSENTLNEVRSTNPAQLKVFFENDIEPNFIKESLNKINDKFLLNFQANRLISKFLENSSTIANSLKYVTIFLGILTLMFILVFSKIISDSKRKEIGILKSLGSSSIQALSYHICTFIAIMILTLFFVLIFYYPTFLLFQELLFNKNSALIGINQLDIFRILILVWLVFFAISIIIFSIMSIKNFKTKTINLLR